MYCYTPLHPLLQYAVLCSKVFSETVEAKGQKVL